MRKAAKWLAVISLVAFMLDWSVLGLKLLDNSYLIAAETYIGLVSLVVFFVCVMYLKLTNRCPHCGMLKRTVGKYCPYCGKEIR